MNKLKEKSLSLLVTALLVITSVSMTWTVTAMKSLADMMKKNQNTELAGSANILSRWGTGSPATTSPQYLSTSSATSSLMIATGNADSIDFNILGVGSTSAATLLYRVSFSNSGTCPLGNADWFSEDGRTISSNTLVTHGAGPVTHLQSLATSSLPVASNQFTKNIVITPVASNCMKVDYSITGANASLWTELALREPLN